MSKYRFGVSGLSKELREYAEKEEIIIQKDTGEFSIRSKDGNFISADKLQRYTMHVNMLSAKAENARVLGVMSEIEVDHDLPTVVHSTTNLLTSPLKLQDNANLKMMFSLDADLMDMAEKDLIPSDRALKLNIDFELTEIATGNTRAAFNITDTVGKLATGSIRPIDYLGGLTADVLATCSISIKQMKVEPIALAGDQLQIIIHSVLIVME